MLIQPGPRQAPQREASNLAPGNYVVYEVPDGRLSGLEFRNPAVLRTLTGGIAVRIEDGKTTEITLTPTSK